MARETFQDLAVQPFKTTKTMESWFVKHFARDTGFWLKFAKKASGLPSVTYEEAREIALRFGWIDGQKQRYDDRHYLIRFTPRRARSPWSKINRGIVEQLIKEGRMHQAGLDQVAAAKADGRWDAAYDSQSSMEVPPELSRLLNKNRSARDFFDSLGSTARYAFLYKIHSAKRTATKERHLAKTMEMLSAGITYQSVMDRASSAGASRRPVRGGRSKQGPGAKKSSTKNASVVPADCKIALLRGINVGGKNKIKMAELRALLEESGLSAIQTYIQSGNILFRARSKTSRLETQIKSVINENWGYDVPVMVMGGREFCQLAVQNPFAEVQHKHSHVTILAKKPTTSQFRALYRAMDAKVPEQDRDEYCRFFENVIYQYCPDGYAKANFVNQFFEQQLKLPATTRNWNTVLKISDILAANY